MPLDAAGQARVAAHWMRENEDPTPFERSVVTATVAAAVEWWDVNATGAGGFNQALPVAFRTGATADQKRRMLDLVLRRMSGTLRTEEDG